MRRIATVILTISICFSLLYAEDESKETPEQTAVRKSPVQKHPVIANAPAAIMSGDVPLPDAVRAPDHSAVPSRERQKKARIILRPQGQPKIMFGTTVPDRKAPQDSEDVPGVHKRQISVDPGCIVQVDPSVDPDIIIPVDKDMDPDIIIDPSPAPETHSLRVPNTNRSPAPDSLDLPLRPWQPDTGK